MEETVDDSDNVKIQCERDWKRLKTAQIELQSLPGEALVDSEEESDCDGNSALCQILHEHEKRLKAELQALQERELLTFPDSANLQKIILEQDQVKRLDQLKDTMTFLRAKRSEILQDIEQAEKASSSLGSLNSALKGRVAAMEEAGPVDKEGGALESVLTDMAVKVDKVSERDRFFKRTLKQLLHEHFPLPQQTGDKKALDDSRDININNLVPLRTIVGKLIEQSVNSPQQPYIEIDEHFWPRHIEFLLRCQIALKDPQNSHRIKLVPFHL